MRERRDVPCIDTNDLPLWNIDGGANPPATHFGFEHLDWKVARKLSDTIRTRFVAAAPLITLDYFGSNGYHFWDEATLRKWSITALKRRE